MLLFFSFYMEAYCIVMFDNSFFLNLESAIRESRANNYLKLNNFDIKAIKI